MGREPQCLFPALQFGLQLFNRLIEHPCMGMAANSGIIARSIPGYIAISVPIRSRPDAECFGGVIRSSQAAPFGLSYARDDVLGLAIVRYVPPDPDRRGMCRPPQPRSATPKTPVTCADQAPRFARRRRGERPLGQNGALFVALLRIRRASPLRKPPDLPTLGNNRLPRQKASA